MGFLFHPSTNALSASADACTQTHIRQGDCCHVMQLYPQSHFGPQCYYRQVNWSKYYSWPGGKSRSWFLSIHLGRVTHWFSNYQLNSSSKDPSLQIFKETFPMVGDQHSRLGLLCLDITGLLLNVIRTNSEYVFISICFFRKKYLWIVITLLPQHWLVITFGYCNVFQTTGYWSP